MPFVRKRITRTGTVSTALVEAYRDGNDQPRQRVLANLQGEPDVLSALAKLAVQQTMLEEEAADKCSWKRWKQIKAALETIERDAPILAKHCSASDEAFQAAQEAYRKRGREAANSALGVAFAKTQFLKEEKKEAEASIRRLSRVSTRKPPSASSVGSS
jgi:hypothetical protein